MNGPEHFIEAERLIDLAANTDTQDPLEDVEVAQYRIACAQVHATLALAAATAMAGRSSAGGVVSNGAAQHVGMHGSDFSAWDAAAGVRPGA